MAMVRVWNKNVHPFKQDFRGDMISIPAGKYILLEEGYAKEFRSHYYPMKKLANGQQDPVSYKMIDLENTSEAAEERKAAIHTALICNKCGQTAVNQSDLDDHILSNHFDDLLEKEEAKEATKVKK